MITKKFTKKATASVVIPVYNTRDLIRRNLPKVLDAVKNKVNRIKEVIVVDDASGDDSASVVKREFPQIKLIRHSQNRGFSSSVNTGARASSGDVLVLLNSDVIPSINFLEFIFEDFLNEKVFAVSLHEEGFTWAKGFLQDGFVGHSQGNSDDKIHETFWVSGGSAAYRRDYWMKLGGMDEKLLSPFYWEDIDLSYIAAKRGLINLWDPRASVIHKHETTISKLNPKYVARIRDRNQLLFHWKNLTSPTLFRRHLLGVLKRCISHPGYVRIITMALSRIGLVIKARRKEVKEAKISDEAIFSKFKYV